MPRCPIRLLSVLLSLLPILTVSAQQPAALTAPRNPIIPGYFADPTIVQDKAIYTIYATIDPWGGDELGVFQTRDFKHYRQQHINWPTKAVCTSPTSGDARVWAPSVVKGRNGKFYMYVAVGSEVWGGVSDSPLGPWKNIRPDNAPMVKTTDYPYMHNIDPDCFIDDDGQAYLYWGSGLHWINGHCMVVRLKKDMYTFDGQPVDVTTPHFFEGAHMVKRAGKYYLMFSHGKATDATYCVGYALGNSPMGPFTETADWRILASTPDSSIIGPGHNTTFRIGSQDYILYHRILPQNKEYVLRQLCIDRLEYDKAGHMLQVH